MKPKDFEGSPKEYLIDLLTQLLPQLKAENLSNRIDIFIEDSAFSPEEGQYYLEEAKNMGFDLTVHADQFSTGGSAVAIKTGALSADHLESSTDSEIAAFAQAKTVAVALPGASIGLGMRFTPARKLLDAGASLAIASDWNPGSAPMGDLLTQAAILGAFEKLSLAETLAGLTFRAALALGLTDRGRLETGQCGDFQAYETNDYRDIFYQQGRLKPFKVWKDGQLIKNLL
jgi:imidazolonepropionase